MLQGLNCKDPTQGKSDCDTLPRAFSKRIDDPVDILLNQRRLWTDRAAHCVPAVLVDEYFLSCSER
jgi:hypothetical protein